MEWYWIVLIVLGGVLLIYTLLCYIVARGVLKQATTPVAHTLQEAREFQMQYENADYTEYDSVWRKENFQVDGVLGHIRGEIVYNSAKTAVPKVAVICHGHTWNRLNSLKYANIFYSKGYNVVMYDHAYFGESDGAYTTLGLNESHDLCAVLDLVREKFGTNAILALHGESMGAATVLLELGLRNDIDFVVADCPFSDTMKYYRELCLHLTHLPGFPIVDMANCMSKRKFHYDFRKVSPIKAVRHSSTPICFIHGEADKFIYPSHSKKMFAASPSSLSELHIFSNAEHARSHVTNKEAYWKVVCAFIDKMENLLVK